MTNHAQSDYREILWSKTGVFFRSRRRHSVGLLLHVEFCVSSVSVRPSVANDHELWKKRQTGSK